MEQLMPDMLTVVPRERWSEAVELLVSRLPDEVRPRQREAVQAALESDPFLAAGLLAHYCGGALQGVCWLQRQAGRTASFWPPVRASQPQPAIDSTLVAKALTVARTQNVQLVQSLLPTDSGSVAELLRQAGFTHVADLLYLVSVADQFPRSAPATELAFASFDDVDAGRLERILERTYIDSRDCPALDGARSIADVVEGYRAVGGFRPEIWLVARFNHEDVGCILLADHAPQRVWELVYMGILPEARGRGLGLEITRYAQWLAAREGVDRLVLAVDAANEPAIALYAAAGFIAWDRRSVFVHSTFAPLEKNFL
jgi:ribosomal protein S18 acetylase RimI-like enzyme